MWASLVVQLVKKQPAMWETWVQSLGWEDPLEKGKTTHSSLLAWRTPWTVQFMEFSRPDYWSGLPFLSSGDLPNPGIEPRSPTLQEDSLPAEPPGKTYKVFIKQQCNMFYVSLGSLQQTPLSTQTFKTKPNLSTYIYIVSYASHSILFKWSLSLLY